MRPLRQHSNCSEALMKHLFNISIYHQPEEIRHVCSVVGAKDSFVDGLELLTGYELVDPSLKKYVVSAHLPFSTDWYGPATGIRRVDPNLSEDSIRYHHYGRDRKEIVETLRLAIRRANEISPMYGVLHASSVSIREILGTTYSDSDEKVLTTFISIMNEVVSDLPEGEPPFTLAFENTWWPGMRLLDGSMHNMLESGLEFEDWGICLDTGHILFASKRSVDEIAALNILNECADSYSDELLDRVIAMHLHVNTSARLIESTAISDTTGMSDDEVFTKGYSRICSIDQHRPFTDSSVKEYVERISPEFVVHELSSPSIPDQIRDHICQAHLLM